MSCFIVNYETINNILSVYDNVNINKNCCWLKGEIESNLKIVEQYLHLEKLSKDEQFNKIGQNWLKLNIKAYFDRYKQDKISVSDIKYCKDYIYKYNRNITIHQALKSLTCLLYQCSDVDNYKTNNQIKQLKELRQVFMEAFVDLDVEYQMAKWGA